MPTPTLEPGEARIRHDAALTELAAARDHLRAIIGDEPPEPTDLAARKLRIKDALHRENGAKRDLEWSIQRWVPPLEEAEAAHGLALQELQEARDLLVTLKLDQGHHAPGIQGARRGLEGALRDYQYALHKMNRARSLAGQAASFEKHRLQKVTA